MKIVLLRDEYAFRSMSREKLFSAQFVGYWGIDGTLTVCKDRQTGSVGHKIYEDDVVKYIEKFS